MSSLMMSPKLSLFNVKKEEEFIDTVRPDIP